MVFIYWTFVVPFVDQPNACHTIYLLLQTSTAHTSLQAKYCLSIDHLYLNYSVYLISPPPPPPHTHTEMLRLTMMLTPSKITQWTTIQIIKQTKLYSASCFTRNKAWHYQKCSYFSFQPVHHDWCTKGCGMCYPVCGMMNI